MRRLPLSVAAVSLAVVALIAASCGGNQAGSPQGPPTSHESPASSVIGPTGGSVSTSNGTRVTVPAGALASTQTVTITPSASFPVPAGATAVGPRYVLGPEGVTFSKPVTVTLAFDPKLLPAGTSASDVKVFTAPVGSTAFAWLPTTQVDATHVTAPTTHFSGFGTCSGPNCWGGSAPYVPTSCNAAGEHGGTQDIKAVCAGTTMYWPCECSATNPKGDMLHQVLPDGRSCASTCVLDPQCPALQEVTKSIREYYNLAALPLPDAPPVGLVPGAGSRLIVPKGPLPKLPYGSLTGIIPGPGGFAGQMLPKLQDHPDDESNQVRTQITWVAWLMGHFYFQGNRKWRTPGLVPEYMDIRIGNGAPGEGAEYADFEPSADMPGFVPKDKGPRPPAQPTMYVTPDCFGNVSPAHLLSTLGHETIHYLQNLRNQGPGKNPRDLPGKVQAFIQDFREWEAYVWEVFGTFQEKDYKYENDVAFACTSDERRFETGFWGDCYNLRIIKRLWVLSGGGYERELALLRAWLAGDDFGNAWLAVNASTFVEVGGRDYTPAEPKCSPCDPPCSSGSSCDTTNGKCMPTSP